MPAVAKYTLKWLFFGFSGRIRRVTYMLSTVFFVALYAYLVAEIMRTPEESTAFGLWGLVFLALMVVSLWSSVALSFKRLHDLGYSGMLSILMLFPFVSFVFFIALCAMPGEPKRNQYGDSP